MGLVNVTCSSFGDGLQYKNDVPPPKKITPKNSERSWALPNDLNLNSSPSAELRAGLSGDVNCKEQLSTPPPGDNVVLF